MLHSHLLGVDCLQGFNDTLFLILGLQVGLKAAAIRFNRFRWLFCWAWGCLTHFLVLLVTLKGFVNIIPHEQLHRLGLEYDVAVTVDGFEILDARTVELQ